MASGKAVQLPWPARLTPAHMATPHASLHTRPRPHAPSAGYAHHGMLAAAQALLAEGEAAGHVRRGLAANPGYGLHLIGHSLGAGGCWAGLEVGA